jgi:hypothetical protein
MAALPQPRPAAVRAADLPPGCRVEPKPDMTFPPALLPRDMDRRTAAAKPAAFRAVPDRRMGGCLEATLNSPGAV